MGQFRQVVTSEADRLGVCRALLQRANGEGPTIPQAVYGAACAICDGDELDAAHLRKLAGLRETFHDRPEVLAFLGGTPMRAAVPQQITDRLERIDLELRAQILLVADTALTETAEAIDIDIRSRVDRSRLNAEDERSFDMLPLRAFLGELEERRPTVRAALTVNEETVAATAVERAVRLVEGLLANASRAVQAELADIVDGVTLAELHEPARNRAVQTFRTAMLAMLFGRLGRATDDDTRILTDAVTPEGVARDVLEIAGGARPTDRGGLALAGGLPVAVDGTPSVGANLAQGHAVSALLATAVGVRSVRVFQHSGKPDAFPAHARAHGRTSDETNEIPGGHRDCGCSWRIEYRNV